MGVVGNADQMASGGLYVNVDGSAGEVTQDPITGQTVIAVNTKGNAGTLGSPIGASALGIGASTSTYWFIGIGILFLGGILLLGRRH